MLGGREHILVESSLTKDQYYYYNIHDILTMNTTEGKTILTHLYIPRTFNILYWMLGGGVQILVESTLPKGQF